MEGVDQELLTQVSALREKALEIDARLRETRMSHLRMLESIGSSSVSQEMVEEDNSLLPPSLLHDIRMADELLQALRREVEE